MKSNKGSVIENRLDRRSPQSNVVVNSSLANNVFKKRLLKEKRVDVAFEKLDKLFRCGGIFFLPASKYFKFLQDLAKKNDFKNHGYVLNAGLAHLTLVPDEMVSQLFTHLLSFIDGSGSIIGLEDYFLSCMIAMQENNLHASYARGISTLKSLNILDEKNYSEPRDLFIYDRSSNIFSMVNRDSSRKLMGSLIDRGFRSPSVSGFIRELGETNYAIDGINPDVVFGNAEDNDKCKDRANTIVQVVGILVGAAIGGTIAGTQGGKGTDQAGWFSLGFSVGTAAGQGLAPLIGSAACKDSGASKETLDSVLADSFDPYANVTADDLANDLPAVVNDDDGKPPSVDSATWDLVNEATSPSETSTDGTTYASNDTNNNNDNNNDNNNNDTENNDETNNDPGNNGPTSPDGIPDPDSGSSGGPSRFGIGALGAWMASFGSDDKSMGGPDDGGPVGPCALPNGSVFLSAPNIFGKGLINTSANIKSVFIENSSSKVSSCLLIGIPRIANGVSGISTGLKGTGF